MAVDKAQKAAIHKAYYERNRDKWAAYAKRYREMHPKGRAEIAKAYRVRHPEKVKAYKAQYECDHPEETRAIDLRSYARHEETRRAYSRRYYIANREQCLAANKAYREENPEQGHVHTATRRALKYQNTKPEELLTEGQWLAILDQHHHRCAYCGIPLDHPTIDHVIPLSRGGRHSADNVVPACLHCNTSKNAKTPAEWKKQRTQGGVT